MIANSTKNIHQKRLLFIAIMLFSFFGVKAQFYYGIQQDFGKNRVVYEDYKWNFYRFDQFDVFFYQRGEANAQIITSNVNEQLKELTNFFRINFDERFQIIVYNSLSDLKQSNLNQDNVESFNTSGVVGIKGNKIFIYATGQQGELISQLRSGITEMLLNYLLFGSNFKKGLSSYSNFSLPTWFSSGLVSYMSEQKSPEIESRIRDGLLSGDLKNFNLYKDRDAKILGYSIWDYIGHKYGQDIIPDLVITAYTYNNVKEAFEDVIGKSFKAIRSDYINYYSLIYNVKLDYDINDLEDEIAYSRNEEKIFNISMSKNRDKAAYTTNRSGLYYIYTLNIDTKKKTKVFKGGYRIPQNEDLSYPLITWHPNGRDLAFIIEEKGIVILKIFNTETEEMYSKDFSEIDKINSISFSKDGNKIVFSGVFNGFSDLYIFDFESNYLDVLTFDSYDDIDPVFKNNDTEIVFSSNRVNEELIKSNKVYVSKENFDLYVFDLKARKIHKATDTPRISEYKSQVIEGDKVSYLTFGKDFTQKLYAFEQDSIISHIDTTIHYRQTFKNFLLSDSFKSILNYSYNDELDAQGQVIYHDGRYRIRLSNNIKDSLKLMSNTGIYNIVGNKEEEVKIEEPKEIKLYSEIEKTGEVDIDNYQFENTTYEYFGINTSEQYSLDFKHKPDSLKPEIEVINSKEINKFTRIYRNIYFASEFKTQVDQSNDNLDYQVFTGGPVFMNNGVSGLFEVTLADVFNNYSITGGFRTDFNPTAGLSLSPNSEFKLQFDDRSKRINKSYQFYRRSRFSYDQYGFYSLRVITNKFQYRLTYPVNPVSSFSGSIAYRRDKEVFLSVDDVSLDEPIDYLHRVTLRFDHTYDNTINYDVNLHRGLRTKIFVELYQGIEAGRNTMFNIGLDARHYLRIHRNIILANRFAMGTSWGSERLAYYLGGVDNVFSPKFDNTLPPSPNINYGFQTLMTNMRGFDQNVRHGTSFILYNAELRVPLIQYFFEAPLNFSLLRHFQVVPFFDAGTAWTGYTPWDRENSMNREEIQSGPITIVLDTQRDPMVYGYGVGLRTKLFGYFMRFDWAWGVDTGVRLPRKFYFSLNLDF
jgi:hypothetical protein